MGGGQWQVLRLVRGLAARGQEAHLLARGELLERALAEGLAAEKFHWTGWPQADIVHAHDARAHTAAVLVGAFAGACPLVVSRRVAYPVHKGFLSRAKYAQVDRFIAVSRFVAAILHEYGVPEEKIDVVYDGVPLLPLADNRERVITPAGKSANGYLQSTDLERDLATASVMVYVSESEGLGSALLLAMSAGVPVVATRVGGILEIVDDGENGLLVPNEAAAIGGAVGRILANLDFYSQRARQKVMDRFLEEHMVENTLAVYRKTLRNV